MVHRVSLNLGYTTAAFWDSGDVFGDSAPLLCLEVVEDGEEAHSAPRFSLSPPDAASLVLLLLSDPRVADLYEEHRAKAALQPLDHSP